MHTSTLRTSVEAADALSIDRSTLTRWVKSGRLKPAMKLPGLRGAFMFDDEAIEAARVADFVDRSDSPDAGAPPAPPVVSEEAGAA